MVENTFVTEVTYKFQKRQFSNGFSLTDNIRPVYFCHKVVC